MSRYRIFDLYGVLVAIAALIFSFFFFTADNAEPMGSLMAAIITAGLAWMTYVGIRLLVLVFRA